MVRLCRLGFGFTLLASVCAVEATAQTIPPASLPGQIDPARQQQRFQFNARPDVGGAAVVETPQQQAPRAPVANSASFTLRGVNVVGATAIPKGELEAVSRDQIGKSVTLESLRSIADRITAHYRNQGYILSRAVVPAGQQVSGGVVTIQVVEGYVDNVVFNGAEEQSQSLLQSYASRIKASKPLNNEVLERYLLLMDDLTGATARGVLSPSGANTGASQLTVTFDYKAIDGNASIDNRGSRFLGPIQLSALTGLNSALGLSERIQVRGIVTSNVEELKFIEGSYQQPVGPEGTTLRVTGSYTETNPGASLEPLDIEGESAAFTIDARHPVIRSRRQNLFATGGFRYRDSDTEILSQDLYDDHIRSFFVGGSYDVLDPLQGINRADFEVVQGVDILNGNDEFDAKSRSNADPEFTRITGLVSRLQPLDRFYSLFLAGSGQYSFDPLYASEEFAIGGPAFGSAYDPAEITGDQGIAGRAELRYSNTAPAAYVDIFQIYGFYDVGKVWNRSTVIGEDDQDSLASTGVGARLTFLESFAASVEVAFPISKDVAAEGSDGSVTRGFFALSYLF